MKLSKIKCFKCGDYGHVQTACRIYTQAKKRRLALKEDGDKTRGEMMAEGDTLSIVDMNTLGEGIDLSRRDSVIPQRQVQEILVPLNTDQLMKVSALYSLQAIANNIGAGLVDTSAGLIGRAYLAWVTILYDLWTSTNGGYSIFSVAPATYWELRQAIQPRVVENFSFRFTSPSVFFGVDGLFPTGVPLSMGGVVISWNVNLGTPLALVNNVVPVLTENDLQYEGPQAVQELWIELSKSGLSREMLPQPVETAFLHSPAAFAVAEILNAADDEENIGWCRFALELPIRGHDCWLTFLGLGLTTDPFNHRLGPHMVVDYMTVGNFGHRIHNRLEGRQPKTVIRRKCIFVEEIEAAVLMSHLVADIKYNEVDGQPVINQLADCPKSPFLSAASGNYLYANMISILARESKFAWINFDGAPCSSCVVTAGTTWTPDSASTPTEIPNWLNEWFASTVPIATYKDFKPKSYKMKRGENARKVKKRMGEERRKAKFEGRRSRSKDKKRGGSLREMRAMEREEEINKENQGGWIYATYPVPVIDGETYANVMENHAGGDGTALDTMLHIYNPDVLYTYNFGGASALPDTIDPLDLFVSKVQGAGIAEAIQTYTSLCNTLQGNLETSSPTANFHTESTMMHYTYICSFDPDDEDGWSRIARARLRYISNRIPFDPNKVSYDLQRIGPVTYSFRDMYTALYGETSVMDFSQTGGDTRLIVYDMEKVARFTHPIAGQGNESANADTAVVTQHNGGGFVDMLYTVAKSLLPNI